MKASVEWATYRTRFLVRARQLTRPMIFVDALGREHSGSAGDYLIESSDGGRRIAPHAIFEDIYVIMDSGSTSTNRKTRGVLTSFGDNDSGSQTRPRSGCLH
jgi:hypothetical protein